MHGPAGAHEFFAAVFDGVDEGKRRGPDMLNGNGEGDLVPDEQALLVIAFGVHDGQEIRAFFKHEREAPAEFFQQGFIGVVDDLELIGEENDAGRVGIVQMNFSFVREHKPIITLIDKAHKDCNNSFPIITGGFL